VTGDLDRGSGVEPRTFDAAGVGGPVSGVVLDSTAGLDPPAPGRGQWTVAVQGGDGAVTGRVAFEGSGSGAEVWQPFAASGAVPDHETAWVSGVPATEAPRWQPAGAVSARVELAPGERRELRFALAWDLPVVSFGSGRRYYRRHTRHTGRNGRNGGDLVVAALEHAVEWSEALDRWHAALLERRPDWLAAMLCNELYLLVDGFSVWTDGGPDGGAAADFFGVIETPEYPFYDTLDLWSYGSWPLALLWPELARNVGGHYAAALLRTDERSRRADDSGEAFAVARPGIAPHDLGSPHEDPVELVNAYTYRDPSRWKDLNAHFVLSAWRDARHDDSLLEAWFPAALAAMERLATFDRDGDGLIENDGWPDQTFDNIPMEGPGVYCGGLWLGALAATAAWAERIGQTEEAARWAELRSRAAAAFEEVLWTGTHYRLDTGPGGDAVFAEQLFGPWFAERTGLPPLLDRERFHRALTTVLETNAGPAGLQTVGGTAREALSQSAEVMVGINLSVANQLDLAGLGEEAAALRRRIHDGIYDDREMWFRTPAAWHPDRHEFRAILNLRPLVLWAGVSDGEAAAFRRMGEGNS
jgi:non-lysosomal glucosylceramidase